LRLLIPNDKPLPSPTGDGLAGLSTACFTINDCLGHRCGKHTVVEALNETDDFDGFIECGACIADTGLVAFLRIRRGIRRQLKADQRERAVALARRVSGLDEATA
jgi:hypothetical protein